MEAGIKRKRDLGCPRITFYAPGRTFERLLREDSLQELKNTVKKKLGLASDAVVSLSQIRDDSTVDLEDEEDFDAFYNVLHSVSTASVRITVSRGTTTNNPHNVESGQASKQKKQRLDSAPQLSPVRPSSNENLPPPVPVVSVPASNKRTVSFAQSKATKDADGRQANEPPAKRPKTASTGAQEPDSSPRTSIPLPTEPSRLANATTGVDPAVKTRVSSQSAESSVPKPSSIAPDQGVDADGSKFSKQKRKKGRTSQAPADPEDDVRGRSSAKKIPDGQQNSETSQNKQPTVEVNPKPSKSGLAATTSSNLPLPEDHLVQKETKLKKKTPLSMRTSQTDIPDIEPPKKTSRSKSKVRGSTGADSETNDKVSSTSDPLLADSLAAISQRMIDKYLTRPASANNVNTGDESTETWVEDTPQRRSKGNITSAPTSLSRLTCPYCGKPLTHDRSHCPLLRSKDPELVANRIAGLKQIAPEDVDGDRENVIEALQGALLRIRGAKAKKGTASNVPSAAQVFDTKSTSTKPNAKTMTESSIKKPSPAPRLSPSPSSGSHSNDDDDDDDDDFQDFAPSRRPPLKASESPTDDDSGIESNSEDEKYQAAEAAFHFEESSNSSDSSSEGELTASLRSRKNRLQLKPQPFDLQPNGVSGYTDEDLEALIRGPGIPLKSADFPSSEEPDEDEGSDDVQLVSESEEEYRDRSQRMQRSYSSSNDSEDEDMDEMGDDLDETFHTPSRNAVSSPATRPRPTSLDKADDSEEDSHPRPVLISKPSQEEPTFQKINGRSRSVDADKTGNEAFEQALREENAVVDLAMRQSVSLPPKQTSPGLTEKPRHTSPTLAVNAFGQEHHPELRKAQAKNSNPPANGTPEGTVEEEAEPVQTAIPDPVELSEVTYLGQRSSDETAADEEAHFAPPPPPPEQPREEPERASTPKPGLVQRMRTKMGLASPPRKSSDTTSNSTVRPTAKPRMVRPASLRSQQGPKTRSHDPELSHEVNYINTDGDVAVPAGPSELSAPKKGASSTTRSASSRTKAATEKQAENAEESTEELDPPPRRTTRAASKAAATNPKITIASLLNDLQPSSRRTRQTKTKAVADGVWESSQSSVKKSIKEAKTKVKKGEAREVEKSLITPPTTEDTEIDGSESQAAERDVLVPPSPSISLNAWEVMPPDTPVGTTQSDGVDELQTDAEPTHLSLKPQFQRKSEFFGRTRYPAQVIPDSEERGKGQGDEKEKSPLFIPSESQTAFPHSQFQTQEPDPVESDSSDSEAEVRAAVVKRSSTLPPQTPQYRTLSEITLEATRRFASDVLKHRQSAGRPRSASSAPAKRRDRLNKLYGTMGRMNDIDHSDDDSGPGSDSDEEKSSHIPKARRAGVGLRGRMSVG